MWSSSNKIWPVALVGVKNWSLVCRKVHKLRMLYSRVGRKPFWLKRVEVG